MADRWERIRSEPRESYRIFSVREDWYRHPEKEGERSFFVIEVPDWVNVIAETPDGRLVLIRQLRPGVGAVRLEIPGGVIDPGEDPAHAAARELREETGYAGDAPELVIVSEPNPATHDNRCHSYLVRDARRSEPRELDHDEIIEVELRTPEEVDALIDAGAFPHALLQLPLLHYLRRRERAAAAGRGGPGPGSGGGPGEALP